MKKAQTISFYGFIVIILGFIIFSSTFFIANSLRDASSRDFAIMSGDTILAKIENKILDIKAIATFGNNEVTASLYLPKRLGNQEYSILGTGEKIKIRVSGPTPISRDRKIGNNIQCSGVSFPPKIILLYNASTNSVTIK